jgi:hypothetical protein
MAEKILSYQMKVDEDTGQPYRGIFKPIENTLSALQHYVNFGRDDGTIQVIGLEDIDLIVHDEGKLLQFPPNRALVDADGEVYDIAVGNILAVRHNDDGEFISILESDLPTIQKYLRPVLKARATLIILPTEEWLEVGEEVE